MVYLNTNRHYASVLVGEVESGKKFIFPMSTPTYLKSINLAKIIKANGHFISLKFLRFSRDFSIVSSTPKLNTRKIHSVTVVIPI